MQALHLRLDDVASDHRRVQRRLVEGAVTEASFSLVRLEALVEALDVRPSPPPRTPGREIDWPTALLRQRFGALAALILRESSVERVDRAFIQDPVSELGDLVSKAKEKLDVLHEELRRRVGTTRSRLALIHRFRQRCEWYEHEALREMAARTPAVAEDLFTRELVRFLFDHGMNPITKPRTGRLEPDILDLDPSQRSSFYVEVKQYARDCRDMLRRGIWQAYETLSVLANTRYDVREGYFIVFRRDGPSYSFPERVQGRSWVLFPVVIDLARNVGSRGGRQVEAFATAELEPRTR